MERTADKGGVDMLNIKKMTMIGSSDVMSKKNKKTREKMPEVDRAKLSEKT